MIIKDEITAPAFLASALVNGDTSELESKADRECLTRVLTRLGDWRVVDIARDSNEYPDSRFTWNYRLYGGDAEGGNVLDYVVIKDV